jgi:hypothetical protein
MKRGASSEKRALLCGLGAPVEHSSEALSKRAIERSVLQEPLAFKPRRGFMPEEDKNLKLANQGFGASRQVRIPNKNRVCAEAVEG